MALGSGSRLGPYEILTLVGAGGMGEVYRARDPRLGRDVAIKILPAAISADAARLRRFEQEARATAALNHPNIVTIYSVEQADGLPFVTMEFVEGASLAQLISRAGMPLGRLLPIAIALADAISAAHSRGIVHRDLKPSNVMVAADDRVKVLDFGLAKLLHVESADLGASALPTEPLTDPGLIVGTLPYMSPEQVQGKPLEQRSDIFSLGVILYELATGQRPFKGETSALLLSSILKDTPPLASEISSGVPRELGRIIRHSLAKDPAQRYQTAIDVRNELAELQQDLSSGSLQAPVAPSRAGWSGGSMWVGAALLLSIAAAAYAAWRSAYPPFRAAAPANFAFEQLTNQRGVEWYPSLTPDGKWFVYEGKAAGNADIYLQSVGGQNPINLTKDSPDDDREPAFSPDGESIAFRSSRQGGGIFVMGRTGESVRRLTDSGYSPAWSPDGTTIVYAMDDATVDGRAFVSALRTVTVATGEQRKIFDGDAVQPSWSPHGLRIAYWKAFGGHLGQRDLSTIPASGGTAVPVTLDPAVDWNPIWSPDGRYLFFSSDRGGTMNLWRVPIDERTGATLGPPETLSAPASSAALMSMSADGRSLAYTALTSSQTIESVSFDAASGSARGTPVTVIGGSRPFTGPDPSPDGRWLTFYSLAPQLDVFLSRSDGSGMRQLTNDPANDRNPTWSPDGSQITFMSNRDGMSQIWSIKPDGSGLRRLTSPTTGASSFNQWSHDGSKMAYRGATPPDDSTMFVFDPRVNWKDQKLTTMREAVEPGRYFGPWSWSPDGGELAGTASGVERSSGPIVIYSFATGNYKRVYDSESADSPIWLNDGRNLLVQEPSRILLLDVVTHKTRELMSIAPDKMDFRWSITRDNRTIYFVRVVEQADVWLMRSK
jgi:Tol biopolymer transport system component